MKEDLTILGKFKSVKALKEAYDNLQREFTKKCQKLSVLTSKNEDNGLKEAGGGATETSSPRADDNPPSEIATAVVCEGAQALCGQGDLKELQYGGSDTRGAYNPDGSLQTDAPVKEDSRLTVDEAFAEKYLLNNPQFMEMVLCKYLKQISAPTAPCLIGGSGRFSLTPPERPNSIKEAGLLAGRLFDK